jgi:hypothetical protein
MNQRERFLNTMRFKPVDRVPLWMPWVWNETYRNWHDEGLPEDMDLEQLYGCDRYYETGIYFGFSPVFNETLVAEDDKTRTYVNFEGITMREFKANSELSMPEFLEFPVKTRDDFYKIKYLLRLNEKTRFPSDWEQKCAMWKDRKIPLRMWGDRQSGFFGPMRNLMGLINLSYAFYDDPVLIEEMMDNRLELMISIIDRSLKDTDIDFFVFWEDMAYKNGPLLSPEMFKKYMVPRYRTVTDHLRSKGVDIIFVDSDGDITKLIPLWLEAGINGIWPFEVQCGMDVVKIRKEYGNDLCMAGGIDKRALAYGKNEIDAELKRISPLLSKGGYIPWPDHSMPPDIPLKNFMYFMDRLEILVDNA